MKSKARRGFRKNFIPGNKTNKGERLGGKLERVERFHWMKLGILCGERGLMLIKRLIGEVSWNLKID
jgi:hypothetical protein